MVSEMHEILTSLTREAREVASQILESDREVEFGKPEFAHFINLHLLLQAICRVASYYTTFYLTYCLSQKFSQIDLIFCMGMYFRALLSRMTKIF